MHDSANYLSNHLIIGINELSNMENDYNLISVQGH